MNKILEGFTDLKIKWQLYSLKERAAAIIITMILLIGSIFFLILSPLHNHIDRLKAELNLNRELLAWIKPQLDLLKDIDLSASASLLPKEMLLSTVDQALKKSDLATTVKEISQTHNSHIQIQFKSVPFDHLIIWLAQQNKRYKLTPVEVSIQPTHKTGIVDAVVSLSVQ